MQQLVYADYIKVNAVTDVDETRRNSDIMYGNKPLWLITPFMYLFVPLSKMY